jgi:endoglucanase
VRAKAFREAGWSPEYTLTEDFALGMELKKRGWHCRYVQAYLAVGEAPSGVRNCFQQRSRWAKGHFQVSFLRERSEGRGRREKERGKDGWRVGRGEEKNATTHTPPPPSKTTIQQIVFHPRHNPLVQAGLPLRDRLLYCSGVFCYLVSALTIPTYTAIPLITIWAGAFPCIIDRWFAAALTAYVAATQLLQYYVRTPRHVEALWFADIANSILWWAYVKAAWRMLWARVFFCCSSVHFKATAKGKGNKLQASIVGDVWLHAVFLFVLAVTIAVAVWQLVAGAAVLSPLLISVLWAAHAAVPPFLLLAYVAVGGPGILMHLACRLAQLVSAGSALAAVGLVWTIKDFNPVQGASGVINGKEIGLAFRELNKKVGASFG